MSEAHPHAAPPEVEQFLPDRDASSGDEPNFDRETSQQVKAYIEAHQAHVVTLHNAGLTGALVNLANSDGMDRLLRRLVRSAESFYYAGGGEAGESVAVVAVGGYGRRELSVHSDIDLLFLHGSPLTPLAATVAERIQYWLWDAGCKVGSAVRSASGTIKLGKTDPTVATNVLDARFLGGETRLYHDLLSGVWGSLIKDPRRFLRHQLEAMEERHGKFGQSIYLLQPNVKEGAGGLRDYHSAYWIARASVPSLSEASDLLHRGLLTEQETKAYLEALEFLWRVRNELHSAKGEAADQMSFEDQERMATRFDYPDGGPGELPVERFMRDYYRHARAIRSGSQSVVEECRMRLEPKRSLRRRKVLDDGFELADGMLQIPYASKVREKPQRIMGAFSVAQDHGVMLSRSAQRVIREHLDLIDDAFREDVEIGEMFDKILASPQRVAHALMTMNEIGVLSAYLPEWEHIVCRWQHVMYHTYTVDVHSIFLVQELRHLWLGDYEDIAPDLTELMRTAEDRPVVFWGCLLHDIGKGFGGDHSDRGAELSRTCLSRLGLSQERAERAVFLVEQHLLMSHVAQRRDLSDPKVIVEFAAAVRDRENLRNLYLVTFADIRASSPGAWNDWKGRLLRELYQRTAEYLEVGADNPDVALEQLEQELLERRELATAELERIGHVKEDVLAFFEGMARRYFLSHTSEQISRHADVVIPFERGQQIGLSVREFEPGHSELVLCLPDSAGLYSRVAGMLTVLGVNILDSQVYTTRANLALEIYRVMTPSGGAVERQMLWDEFKERLPRVLAGQEDLAELLRNAGRARPRDALGSQGGPQVVISNLESDFYTVIDVTANDRPGLLYDLTRVLAEKELGIHVSKASTILDQVADTFYVRKSDGHKLIDAGGLDDLRAALSEVARAEAPLE